MAVADAPMVTVKLPLDQVNIILQCLGEQPYKIVAEVISQLRVQIIPQVQQQSLPRQEKDNVTTFIPGSVGE